jgi:hypothetical protein
MFVWLIILASAVGGGFVILHGFSKWKEGGELILSTYQDMLNRAAGQKRRQKLNSMGRHKRVDHIEAMPADNDKQVVR